MDLNRIFLWITIAWCAILLARLGRKRFSDGPGWAAVCVLVPALAGACYVFAPSYAGWVAAGVWMVLLWAPLQLGRLVARRALEQRFAAARRYAIVSWVLHPFDGSWVWPQLIGAVELGDRGEIDRATAALARLLRDPRIPARMRPVILAHKARIAGDWNAVLAVTRAGHDSGNALGSARIRALGETGRLRDMVAAFRASGPDRGLEHELCLLFLFAFCGRRAAVANLLEGQLAALDADAKWFWLATADLAAGAPEARAELAVLAGLDRPIWRTAQRRLEQPPANPNDQLGPAEWQVVADADAALRRDAAYGLRSVEWRRCHVVIGLIVLNVAVFAAEELAGGSDSMRVLDRLGAMWPPAVVERGEWWRLASAIFLHLGPAHLGFNMLALAVIGPWVEWIMGHWRMLLVYLGSGVGSMAAVLLIIRQGYMGNELLVGASGAIFGLVGAQAVLLGHGWRRLGSRLAAQRLIGIGLIVVLQVIFDLTTPEVSFTAHAFGLVVGLCLTALLVVGADMRPERSDGRRLPSSRHAGN